MPVTGPFMALEKRLGLNDEERIFLVVRTAPVTVLVPALVSAAFILVPLFFLMPLLSWGTFGRILLTTSLGIGLFFGLRTAVKWLGTMAVLTDRRIFVVLRDGYLARKVHSMPYAKTQGVSYRIKGVTQTVFRYGTVLIRPMAGKAIRFPRVARPAVVEGLIAECIEAYEAGTFSDLLHAVDDMESRELHLLKSEIERSLKHRQRR